MDLKINDANNIFFTADLHLGHANIIKYAERPFSDVHEMNKAITYNWNSKVNSNSIVIVAGDFCFGDPAPHLKHLNGKIILVLGDHDKAFKKRNYGIQTCDILCLTTNEKLPIIISHWCFRVWRKSHFNSIHLYGHSHGRLSPIGKSWDIGVDVNNFAPIHLKEIMKIMEGRPNNPNYLGSQKDSVVVQGG